MRGRTPRAGNNVDAGFQDRISRSAFRSQLLITKDKDLSWLRGSALSLLQNGPARSFAASFIRGYLAGLTPNAEDGAYADARFKTGALLAPRGGLDGSRAEKRTRARILHHAERRGHPTRRTPRRKLNPGVADLSTGAILPMSVPLASAMRLFIPRTRDKSVSLFFQRPAPSLRVSWQTGRRTKICAGHSSG